MSCNFIFAIFVFNTSVKVSLCVFYASQIHAPIIKRVGLLFGISDNYIQFNLIKIKSSKLLFIWYITRCHINGSIENLFFASQGFLMIRTASHEHATVWIRNPWLAKMRGSGFRTAWPSIFLQDVWNATSNIIFLPRWISVIIVD